MRMAIVHCCGVDRQARVVRQCQIASVELCGLAVAAACQRCGKILTGQRDPECDISLGVQRVLGPAIRHRPICVRLL